MHKILPFFLLPFFAFAHPEQNPDLFHKDDSSFMVSGEFLYWTVSEGALDYAIRMRGPSWGPSDSYAQGDMERAEYDWNPGYRLAFGYYRAPNFWEADCQWTQIHIEGKTHHTRPPEEEGRYMTATWPQVFTTPLVKATSTIHFHYQVADLIANRVFHPFDNPHLRLRLSGGLKGVWIHQGWRVQYMDGANAQTSVNNKWRYWGFGLSAGIAFDWFWGKDFYVTGRATTSLVSGHYHNHAKQETNTIRQVGDDTSVPIRDVRYKDYRLAYSAQFLLGPSYQKCFTNWRMELFAGYEMTIWTNLQEIYRSTASSASEPKETWINKGLIALQGLTARATFNF